MSRFLSTLLLALPVAAITLAPAGCGRTTLDVSPFRGDDAGRADGGGVDARVVPPDGGFVCRSDMDCSGIPTTPVCDVASGRCVECNPSPDNCPVGHRCDAVTHHCVPGCRSDMDCSPPTPRCRLDIDVCVACLTSRDCDSGEMCVAFACRRACRDGCRDGETCCGEFCANLSSDASNCGGCGNVCGPFAHATAGCASARCNIAACDSGFADCNASPMDGCETDLSSSPTSCGMCGRACGAGETCSGGVCVGACGPRGCAPGLTCCDTSCRSTSSDVSNCGGCGRACPGIPNGTAACLASMCGVGSCNAGFADCNGAAMDGCETDLGSDPRNCSGCGNLCASGETCSGGRCVGACSPDGSGCAPGLMCCGIACANTSSDTRNCGMCGRICGPLPNASVTCVGGDCRIGACNPGFANCDGLFGNGCETDTRSSPANCGGCGLACSPGQMCVGSTCTGGGCRVTGCPMGRTCCGDTCVDTTADPTNCGGCFVACPPGAPVCMMSACCTVGPGPIGCGGMVCPDGQTNCGGVCVDETSDPANCGGCGFVCGPGQMCVGSMCTGGGCAGGPTCAPGQTCCATGCATTASDVNNCGGCGVVCPGTGAPHMTRACSASMCTTACDAGFGNCDGVLGNGCEADFTRDPLNCGRCGNVCAMGSTCMLSVCTPPDEGPFNPIVNPTYLTPGVHRFSTITIPAGVVVYVAGTGAASGTLDLVASGDVRIDGTIDVSGGPGTQNTITSRDTNQGRAGAGGYTGEVRSAAASPACQFIAGNGGLNGPMTAGSTGTCPVGSTTVCRAVGDRTTVLFAAPAAQYGGGAGVFTGYRAYGSGGGGVAGGGPGEAGAPYEGERDCSGLTGGGGAAVGQGGAGGSALYSGGNGVLGQTECMGSMPGVPPAYVGGGGGGSIGAAAAADLAVRTTFQAGSGGGGGSADYLNRPVFVGTSGGGGRGGSLRVSSSTTIVVTGRLLANGGEGGDAFIGNGAAAGCDPQPGAAGGGGSGGLIYLAAPRLTVGMGAVVSAVGGLGGAGSRFSTGGDGGNGGPGRVRISATPATCTLTGAFSPALVAGCAATVPATPGRAYVGVYPD